MKIKTINAVIFKKMKEWQETLPDDLAKMAARDTVVTGGCIASMLLREGVNDFDVYFKTKETAKAIARHYIKEFNDIRKAAKGIEVPIFLQECQDIRGEDRLRIVVKSAGIASDDDSGGDYQYFEARPPEEAASYVSEVYGGDQDIEQLHEDTEAQTLDAIGKYHPVFMSTNAITLANKLQIVLRFYGEPEALHENYDFVHCTNYWTAATGVVTRKEALESLLSKELRYVGSRYPVCSMIRVRKFISRGWSINAGQLVKMAFQVSELDMTRIDVLEDQLTGVDVAYFNEVIEKMREKDKERVDSAYLLEIINRIF